MATLNEKIELLVAQANKKVAIDPYNDYNLGLLEVLNKTLDAALILMLLIEQQGD